MSTTANVKVTAGILPSRRNQIVGQLDLIVTPIFFAILAILLVTVWVYSDFDQTTTSILEPSGLWTQFQQQISLALWSTALVIVVAIPLGIVVTRDGAPRLKNNLVTGLGLGQAIPAYGLIVLFYVAFGQGSMTVVLALATFALLPVLRNTIVGLEQVDQSVRYGTQRFPAPEKNRIAPCSPGDYGRNPNRHGHQRRHGDTCLFDRWRWPGRDDRFRTEERAANSNFCWSGTCCTDRIGSGLPWWDSTALPQAKGTVTKNT